MAYNFRDCGWKRSRGRKARHARFLSTCRKLSFVFARTPRKKIRAEESVLVISSFKRLF